MKNPPTKGAVQKISFRVRLNNKKSKIFDKKRLLLPKRETHLQVLEMSPRQKFVKHT